MKNPQWIFATNAGTLTKMRNDFQLDGGRRWRHTFAFAGLLETLSSLQNNILFAKRDEAVWFVFLAYFDFSCPLKHSQHKKYIHTKINVEWNEWWEQHDLLKTLEKIQSVHALTRCFGFAKDCIWESGRPNWVRRQTDSDFQVHFLFKPVLIYCLWKQKVQVTIFAFSLTIFFTILSFNLLLICQTLDSVVI